MPRSRCSAITTSTCSPSPPGTRRPHRQDTLAPILEAPDRDELIDWLAAPAARRASRATGCSCTPGSCRRGHRRPRSCFRARSRRCSRASAPTRSCASLYGDEPRTWRDDLDGFDRLRVDRQRVHAAALLHRRRHDGVPREARTASRRRRASARGSSTSTARRRASTVVCGHWSTLELKLAPEPADARFGLPVGRHADRGQAAGSPRLPGAESRSGDAKTVRIAPPPRARARGGAARARAAAAVTCSSATSARSPVTRQNDATKLVSPT